MPLQRPMRAAATSSSRFAIINLGDGQEKPTEQSRPWPDPHEARTKSGQLEEATSEHHSNE
eukprot:6425833-Pyramimonas_sp.AAC.1